MIYFTDIHERQIRLSEERKKHIEEDHPEMREQTEKIVETLKNPEIIKESSADSSVELFYRFYTDTPVEEKYLCIVVKVLEEDLFIITAYFTDRVKQGRTLWEKK